MMKRFGFLSAPFLALAMAGCMAVNVGKPDVYTVERGDLGRLEVTRQKRMSFGFFPALAEGYCRPPESVHPLIGWGHVGNGRYSRSRGEPMDRYFFLGWLMTPWSLLVTPWHGDYRCSTHHWNQNGAELIRLLPEEARRELGVETWLDDENGKRGGLASSFTHSALFGFHRYETVVVEEKDAGDE